MNGVAKTVGACRSRHATRSLLSHVFVKAIRWGSATQNPARGLDLGRGSPRRAQVRLAQVECSCGSSLERIGEDVSEKLDYTPGVFEVERHIRGKWVCRACERLIQAPVAPHVIDKGIPTAGLLAQVLIAKYL
jgi:hypothetical protein